MEILTFTQLFVVSCQNGYCSVKFRNKSIQGDECTVMLNHGHVLMICASSQFKALVVYACVFKFYATHNWDCRPKLDGAVEWVVPLISVTVHSHCAACADFPTQTQCKQLLVARTEGKFQIGGTGRCEAFLCVEMKSVTYVPQPWTLLQFTKCHVHLNACLASDISRPLPYVFHLKTGVVENPSIGFWLTNIIDYIWRTSLDLTHIVLFSFCFCVSSSGLVSHSDLDDRAIEALKEFNEEGALQVLLQFKDSDLSHVQVL